VENLLLVCARVDIYNIVSQREDVSHLPSSNVQTITVAPTDDSADRKRSCCNWCGGVTQFLISARYHNMLEHGHLFRMDRCNKCSYVIWFVADFSVGYLCLITTAFPDDCIATVWNVLQRFNVGCYTLVLSRYILLVCCNRIFLLLSVHQFKVRPETAVVIKLRV